MQVTINLTKTHAEAFAVAMTIILGTIVAVAAPLGPTPSPGHSGDQIANGSITGSKLADNLAITGNASINYPTFVVNGSRVGIGTSSPTSTLNVVGSANITGNLSVGNGTVTISSSGIRFPDASVQTSASTGASLNCTETTASGNPSATASCPSNYTMTGGGCDTGLLLDSFPSGNGWYCATSSGLVTTYARCCRLV